MDKVKESYATIKAYLREKPKDLKAISDYFEIIRANADDAEAKLFLTSANRMLRNPDLEFKDRQRIHTLVKNANLFLAPRWFHNFMVYLEWDRDPKRRFYQPRMKALKPIVDNMQDLSDGVIDLLALSCPPGVGKALADDTPVLTRSGWKKHGDLMVGDEVIGLDGKFKKVTHVHPKCMLDRLVTFSNGEQILCHENHEWMFYCRGDRKYRTRETKVWETFNLEQGGHEHKRGHRYVYQLPPRCVIGEHKDLFSPYTLGVWLGDGTNTNPTITNDLRDYAIIDKIWLKEGYEPRWVSSNDRQPLTMWYGFDFRKELRAYGMCHSKKRTPKHIPEEYLTASIEQRLELLAGLIDTDGNLTGSKYHFTTCDIELRDSVIDLLHTFGWRVSVVEYAPTMSSSGIMGRKTTYCLSFTPDLEIPCALARKKNREPRRQRAIGLQSIEKVEPVQGNCITVDGDGMYLVGKTMIPTHNSTLAIFYLAFEGGKHPELPNLGCSHNAAFLKGIYDELLRIVDPEGEYLYNDVFPNSPLVNTNAKDLRIDLQQEKRFETFEFTSVGAGNAGKVRAMNLLYCDDLVDGIETALSITQLDKLWGQYHTDLRQRKQGDRCKELHIATRWSVHDVIGRLQEQYKDDPKARFLAFPAMNEKDQSNFDYPYGLGFSTEFYRKQRDIMDDASWRALYMNEPIEREGLLYDEDELQYYIELPDGDPDTVIAVCDTKDKGSDFYSMPIFYQYGDRFYLEDVVYDDSLPEVVDPRIVSRLIKNKVKLCQFESNAGGSRVAVDVDKAVRDKGWHCHITSKYTTKNKETRIFVSQQWVKEHCIFKSKETQVREYKNFMQALCSYTHIGKNAHDDAPDSLAMFADLMQNQIGARAELRKRPF